jgi:hypothetical protein
MPLDAILVDFSKFVSTSKHSYLTIKRKQIPKNSPDHDFEFYSFYCLSSFIHILKMSDFNFAEFVSFIIYWIVG